MKKVTVVTTEDILIKLCNSVTKVFNAATTRPVQYSAMVQKIHKTCLRPDIGCFVLFDGGFSGLVVINFSAASAMEIYRDYMLHMGIPENELASQHTQDDVSNVMGELMNQIVGDFTSTVGKELQTSITQNQPKMLTINKQVQLSVDTNLDRPQARRVTFTTSNNNIFYLELAMDKTEFIQLHDFEAPEDIDPDELINQARETTSHKPVAKEQKELPDQDLFDELGI